MPTVEDVHAGLRLYPIRQPRRRTALSRHEFCGFPALCGRPAGSPLRRTDLRFAAAKQFARIEGILPAPESSHAIRVAIDEALKCKETGEEKTIVFGLTGTGYFDMVAYEKYNNGEMTDYIPTDEELEASFAKFPKVD